MLKLRLLFCTLATFALFPVAVTAAAQEVTPSTLPEAPSSSFAAMVEPAPLASALNPDAYAGSMVSSTSSDLDPQEVTRSAPLQDKTKPAANAPVDANGNSIPLDRQQPQRILGFMPNFRSVAAGAKPHPPGWKYNFTVATHQAFDYSSFIFLFLTTISAEGINEHPKLGKGIGGFYSYGWRGFLDKTDGNYLGGWFLPSLLHEDTRYYAVGNGHSVSYRVLYVMSRQVATRTYGGRQTVNLAGLGGKVLTQIVSKTYYPAGTTTFGVLAEKFAYSAMRDIAFTSIREFYPDIAAHYVRKHREKVAKLSAQDTQTTAALTPRTP